MITTDTIIDAARELVDALDENEAGMPVESNESAGTWFTRSEARVRDARARCAEILSARAASKDGAK